MGKSLHEGNIAYFLEKQRFGDLIVYLGRRTEILWMIQLTVVSSIILLGVVATTNEVTAIYRGLMGLAVFLVISIGLIYWFLLGRFEKKIAAAIKEAEKVLI